MQHDLEEAADRLNEAVYLYAYLPNGENRYATEFATELELIRQCAESKNVDLSKRVSV